MAEREVQDVEMAEAVGEHTHSTRGDLLLNDREIVAWRQPPDFEHGGSARVGGAASG